MIKPERDVNPQSSAQDSEVRERAPILSNTPFVALDGEMTVRHENALAVERISGGYRVSLAVVDPSAAGLFSDLESGKVASRADWDRILWDQHTKRVSGASSSGYVDGQPTPSLVITVKLLGPDLQVDSCRVSRESDVRVSLRPYRVMTSVAQKQVGESDLDAAMVAIAQLGVALYQVRRQRGDVVFADVKQGLLLQPDGSWELYEPEEMLGRIAIQEITSRVVEGIAKLAASHNVPLIYQGCAEANPEVRRRLGEELKAGRPKTREDIDQYLLDTNSYRLRLLHRREYSATPIPHAGLHLDAYARVSAPLREFVDCINLQQLIRFAQGEPPLYEPFEIEAFIAQASQRDSRRIRRKGSDKYSPLIKGAIAEMSQGGSISLPMLRSLIADCRDAGRLPGEVVEYLVSRIESQRDELVPILSSIIFSDFIGISGDLRSAGKKLLKTRVGIVDELIQLGIDSGSLSMQASRVSNIPQGGLAESVWCVDGRLIIAQRFKRGLWREMDPAELTHVHRIQFAKLCGGSYPGQGKNVGKSELVPHLRRLEFELMKRDEPERLFLGLHAQRFKSGETEHVFSVTYDLKDPSAVLCQNVVRNKGWLEAAESSAVEILKQLAN